jgi:hypothetical protein
LDTHLNRFATKEGFDNAPECFMELERLVTEDAEEHKRRMAEMQENLRRQQEEYSAAMKSADDGDSATPPAKQPLMIFFQPISLEQLMQMVLNMAEYPTFSFMMRMKVQQIKLMKAIREQMEAAHRNTHMEVEDIELVEENPLNNDADFATTTAAMDSAGGKSSPESNRK